MHRVIVLVILFFSVMGVIYAQNDFLAPIVYLDHQIQLMDANQILYPACQPSEVVTHAPIPSHDGRYIAILTQPETLTTALTTEGGFGGGTLPSNVWVCNLADYSLSRLGIQNDLTYSSEQGLTGGTARSLPVWSSDGARLVWTEFNYMGDTEDTIAHYDVDHDVLTPSAPLAIPPAYGVPRPWQIIAYRDGFWVYGEIFDSTTSQSSFELIEVDPITGAILNRIALNGLGEPAKMLTAYTTSGEEVLLFVNEYSANLEITMVDPTNGIAQPISLNQLELYHPQNPNGVSLRPTGTTDNYRWQVYVNGAPYSQNGMELGFTTLRFSTGMNLFAPAPNGNQMLVWQGRVVLWDNGNSADLSGMSLPLEDNQVHLLWSARAWRVYPETATDSACTGVLTPRLVIGQSGVVIDSVPNRIRAEATTSNTSLGQIPSGAEFLVLEGPVCDENMVWWRVDYGGLVGWTVEGADGVYWLAPSNQ